MPTDLSLAQMLYRLVALILISGIHGLAIAGIARLLDDRGPEYDGRLTPNPFVHLDLIGIVVGIITRCGWIKPVNLDHREMRGGVIGLLAAILLPLVMLLVLAAVVSSLRWVPVAMLGASASFAVTTAMIVFVECSIWYAVFNLIPMPPLAAGSVLGVVAPKLHRTLIRNSFWITFLIAAITIGIGTDWLRPVVVPLTRSILGN